MSATTEVQVSELSGIALDYAAGKASGVLLDIQKNHRKEGFRVLLVKPFVVNVKGHPPFHDKSYYNWFPKSDPAQGFELIHKHAVSLTPDDALTEFGGDWWAVCINAAGERCRYFGEHPLIAGLRAIVGAVTGPTVNIPNELLEGSACTPE